MPEDPPVGLVLAQTIVLFTALMILGLCLVADDMRGYLWIEGFVYLLMILTGLGFRFYCRRYQVKLMFRSSIGYVLWWSWAGTMHFSLAYLNLIFYPCIVVALFAWVRVLEEAWTYYKERRRGAKS